MLFLFCFALDCIGLHWFVLDCVRLHWTTWDHVGLQCSCVPIWSEWNWIVIVRSSVVVRCFVDVRPQDSFVQVSRKGSWSNHLKSVFIRLGMMCDRNLCRNVLDESTRLVFSRTARWTWTTKACKTQADGGGPDHRCTERPPDSCYPLDYRRKVVEGDYRDWGVLVRLKKEVDRTLEENLYDTMS